MSSRPTEDLPAVGPLGVDDRPRPDREPPAGPGKVVVAGVIGLALGFVVGLVAQRGSGEPAPDTTAALPTTATTAPVTTVGPEPTAGGGPGGSVPLAELVPGLDGTLVAWVGSGTNPRPRIWSWPAAATEPTVLPPPPGTLAVDWDASGRWAAALARSPVGPTLYIGIVEDAIHPVYTGASSFRWHPEDEGAIAWIGVERDLGHVLYRGRFSALGFEYEEVAALQPGPILSDVLVAWGDWGYVLFRRTQETLGIVTYDPDGDLVADGDGLELAAAGPDGTLYVVEQTAVISGSAPIAATDVSLTDLRDLGWSAGRGLAISHDGRFAATITETSFGSALDVHGPATSFQTLLDSSNAIVLGWSADDRFVIAWAPESRLRTDPAQRGFQVGPALVFVDLQDRSVHAVAVEADVGAVAIG